MGVDWDCLLNRIPLVNYVYQLLFDDAPSYDGIRDMVATIGLIATLTLTSATALPSFVDYDQLVSADARWETDYKCMVWSVRPSVMMAEEFAQTVSLLFGAVISTIFVYLSIVSQSMANKELTAEMIEGWWRWGRWALLWCAALTVAGLVIFLMTMASIMIIKWPDHFLESFCAGTDKVYHENVGDLGNLANEDKGNQSPYFVYYKWRCVLVAWVVPPILMLGQGGAQLRRSVKMTAGAGAGVGQA